MTTTAIRPLTPTSIPAERGEAHGSYDGRYRLYTVEHLPFDALPGYSHGGPSTVVTDGWSMSTSSICRFLSSASVAAADDGKHTLSLRRLRDGADHNSYDPEAWEKHELDGGRYALRSDASEAAYNVGALAFMVYHRDAPKWGLPA